MTDWFYGLPIWLATILVLGLALAVGLAGSLGLQSLFKIRATDEEKEVAINLMQVVAAYVGIMIAFAGVQVWQDFADAKAAVSHEAATASELYQGLATYGPETAAARNDLRSYVSSVINDEWPRLQEGEGSPATELALADLYNEIGRIRPQDNRDSTIYEGAFGKLDELVAHRRERIIESQTGIPVLLWAIGLVGAFLTVSYASAFTRTRFNVAMISGISLTLGLVFLFILVVDHPFKGEFAVNNRELVELFAEFDILDRRAATAAAN